MKTRGFLCAVTLFAAVNISAAQKSNPPVAVTPQSNTAKAATTYGSLPMSFEGNVGQTDPRVKFLSRGSGYVVFLTSGGMVFSAHSQFVPNTGAQANAQATSKQQAAPVIQLNLVGAKPNPVAVGENPQAGKVNYFIGYDRSKWHT